MKVPERWTLSNGMSVLYARDPGFPLASATLLFRAGSRLEPASEAGLCSMTVDLLVQGTRSRSARRLAEDMESVGASIGTQVHEDYSELGFVVPASEMDQALSVISEVLGEPSFPSEEIVKEKAHVLASLASRRDAIFNLSYDRLNAALYGRHPYGRPVEGDERSVRGFTRGSLQAWHHGKIRPEQGILSLISPLSGHEMFGKLEKTLGRWRPKASGLSRSVASWPVAPLKSDVSEKLRSSFEQAYLMVGWPAPAADHKDQIPLKVLNALLGGGMSSRLFVTLREKFGLAYEVSSFYPTRLGTSQWVIYLGLPSEKLKMAALKLNELLEGLADQGPTESDLAQAKAMIRGAFLMDRQSRRRQAWYGAWWELLGRGAGYGERFLKSIDAVTAGELRALMQSILKQPRVTVTVVPK